MVAETLYEQIKAIEEVPASVQVDIILITGVGGTVIGTFLSLPENNRKEQAKYLDERVKEAYKGIY